MPDDLRTRIAKATWISHRDRQLAKLGMKPSEYAADIPTPDWAYAIADAVIRELGLREERTVTELVTDPYSGATWRREGGHRYVTDWIADE